MIGSEPQKAAFDRDGVKIYLGDCRDILPTLPAESVHCCVTSPPYFGLRDYGCDGQIGLEPTPSEFVNQMVAVFRDVRRVLRNDGVCWLNLGDSYASDVKGSGGRGKGLHSDRETQYDQNQHFIPRKINHGLKPKDLIGIPWRVAFALQEDGWWLRQEIIWHKPNPMPESVTDRCTKSHEQIFLLTKSDRYFFDNQAIQEAAVTGGKSNLGFSPDRAESMGRAASGNELTGGKDAIRGENRNKRSVWTVTTKPYDGAHFAVFPPDLIEPCILAGTSESGCCATCGTPWRRQMKKERVATRPGRDTKTTGDSMTDGNRDPQRHCTTTKTIGWEAGCKCESGTHVPCVVLDPFTGSGTTAAVAKKNGCHFVGCELNPDYLKLAADRFKQRSLALG